MSWARWRSSSRPASRYRPSAASSSPAATMRESAVRIVPPAMPNSSASATSARGGQHRRMRAEQDRQCQRAGVERLEAEFSSRPSRLDWCRCHCLCSRRSEMVTSLVMAVVVAGMHREGDMVPPDVAPARRAADRAAQRPRHAQPAVARAAAPDPQRAATRSPSSSTLAQSFGIVIAAAVVNTWWSYLVAFVLMTRGHVCLNILAHESAHRLLFTNRRANDWVGRFLLAYPTYLAMLVYRRVHFAHHRDEMGPDEPDTALYTGYPIAARLVAAQADPRRHGRQRLQELPRAGRGDGEAPRRRRSRSSPCRR